LHPQPGVVLLNGADPKKSDWKQFQMAWQEVAGEGCSRRKKKKGGNEEMG